MNNKQVALLIVLVVIVSLFIGYKTGIQSTTTSSKSGEFTPLVREPETQSASGLEESVASPVYGHVHALAYIPEMKTLYLGAHYGLFKSVDGGSNFVKLTPKDYWPSDDVMAFALHPSDHLTIYAAGHDLGVVKSTDGGETWEKSDSGIRGTDIHGLTINQRAPNYLFAFSVGNGVFRSTDGGLSWKRMDDGPENPSVRSLAYMAVQTNMDKSMGWDNWGVLFAGTADGIYESFSCFCGWVKSTDALETTVYSMVTHHSDLRTMYTATKDGLFKSLNEGKEWSKLNGMTSGKRFGALAVDPSDTKHLFAATEDGVVFESQDAGKTWMLK